MKIVISSSSNSFSNSTYSNSNSAAMNNNLLIPVTPCTPITDSDSKRVIIGFIPPTPDPLVKIMRQWILSEAKQKKYFLTYGYVSAAHDITQPKLWSILDQMGDEDVADGRPRTDVLVGRDEPSEGHYKEKKMSCAHNTRWEQIKYVREEIVKICNYYNMDFNQKVVLPNGEVKFFKIIEGVERYKGFQDRKPVKRIVEKQKTLLGKHKYTTKQ